jgi:hypothetical protein
MFNSRASSSTVCLPLQNCIVQRRAVLNEPKAITAVRFEWHTSCMQLLSASPNCSFDGAKLINYNVLSNLSMTGERSSQVNLLKDIRAGGVRSCGMLLMHMSRMLTLC